jgi:hypothetical protein
MLPLGVLNVCHSVLVVILVAFALGPRKPAENLDRVGPFAGLS